MKYVVDSKNSVIEFQVMKFGAPWEKGVFEKVWGEIVLDAEKPARNKVSAKIDIGSVRTKDPGLDKHLKSADFFEVEKYPFALFKSREVEKINDKKYKVKGDLTIRNIKRETELDVVFKNGQEIEATTILNVADFEMVYGFEENHKIKINIKAKLINK